MRQLLGIILFFFSFIYSSYSQNQLDKENGLNKVKLNHTLQHYQESLYLITGDESLYRNNDWLRKSVKRNIEKGVREGIYKEHSHLFVAGKKASKLSLIFYKDELYKIRWSFLKEDHANLKNLAKTINDALIENFGSPNDQPFSEMMVWEESKNHLQTFLDEREFQIELRDNQIENTVKNL